MRFKWMWFLPFLGDTFALCFSGWLAYNLRTSSLFIVDPYLLNPGQYLFLLGTGIGLWHFLLALRGGYADRSLLFRIDELLLQFKTSLILLLLLMSATFLYHRYDYSRLILFFGWVFFVFFGSLARQISHRIIESLHRKGYGRKRAILHGIGPKSDLFKKRICENPSVGIDLVEMPLSETLISFLQKELLDEVFLFENQIAYEKVWELREKSLNQAMTVHLVPPFGNLYLKDISGGFFDGMVLIRLDSPVARKFTIFVKRVLDLLISIFFMVLLSPFLALFSILVKIDSPGPVFFRQKRIGLDGKEFTIYKFRTMYEHVEAYAFTPIEKSDPRITRVGSILRSTGLDELPQLWNVIKGEMSLVGPRPEMPFIVDHYNELERKRLKVKPGITGLWQVYARSANLPIHSHVEFDLYYIENFSISLDLMILLDTIPTLILRTGI